MEILIGLITLVLILLWLLRPSARLRELGDKIPGPKTMPIFGNALNFHIIGTKTFGDLMKARKECGPTFKIWLGPQLHVFICHPEDIQMLLSSQTFIAKANVYGQLKNWLGTGLLISAGALWQRRRKAITPTFHFKVLDDFVPVFNKCANTLVSCLRERSGNGSFDISPYISNCALDAVAESAMGIQLDAQKNPNSNYVVSLLKMTNSLGKKMNYPWLGLEPLYTLTGRRFLEQRELKVLHALPGKVLKERNETFKKTTDHKSEDEFGLKKRKAFLELLLNIQREENLIFQSDQDVMDEVTTFMFEGHDTTTISLSFTTWLIGNHPDVQENLYKEVSSIIEENPNLRKEDLEEMKYLERVIKESLRLYPPVPIIGRRIDKETTFPSGYTIPAGTEIYASIIVVHRDAEFFPEPDKFDPDRFLTEQKHPYAYIPFSAGPRNCIGGKPRNSSRRRGGSPKEIKDLFKGPSRSSIGQKFAMLDLKAILAQIVYNYKITSTDKDIILDHELLLRNASGVNVTLTQRNPTK